MEEQIMIDWQCQNYILQRAYNEYQYVSKQKEKDAALSRIQRTLERPPFMNFYIEYGADIFGISRYGLEYQLEQCIWLIDKIARGGMDYNY